MDDHDGSWLPGQQFDWFIFGDCGKACHSPLANWVVDESRTSPDLHFCLSRGAHNGPTLGVSVATNSPDSAVTLPGFAPVAIGDSLHYAGTSTAFVPELYWSNLISGNGGRRANRDLATRVERKSIERKSEPVPEPAPLLGTCIATGFGAIAQRQQKGSAHI